jgi:hypothetical protein
MTATALEIVHRAADELGLPRPATFAVTAQSDPQARQLAALVNRDGRSLVMEHGWTALQTEHVIEFGAPIEETGDTTAGSGIVTGIDTTGLTAGASAYAVSGSGIQQATRIASIDSTSQLTLTQSVGATATGATLTFTRDTFDVPSDFDRYIDGTKWDRRFQWAMIGPTSPQADQWMRSGIVPTGPRRHFRHVGKLPTAFRVFPPPTASGDYPGTLAWEYISRNWVYRSGDDTYRDNLAADTDVPLFDEDIMVLGAKWRMWQIKGFNYAALQAEYIDLVNARKAHDGGMPVLGLSRRTYPHLLSASQVQDGNFPAPG